MSEKRPMPPRIRMSTMVSSRAALRTGGRVVTVVYALLAMTLELLSVEEANVGGACVCCVGEIVGIICSVGLTAIVRSTEPAAPPIGDELPKPSSRII
jgi:hypothetical protein